MEYLVICYYNFLTADREYLFFTTNAMLFSTAAERDGIKVIIVYLWYKKFGNFGVKEGRKEKRSYKTTLTLF
jgi:hypothetical protein